MITTMFRLPPWVALAHCTATFVAGSHPNEERHSTVGRGFAAWIGVLVGCICSLLSPALRAEDHPIDRATVRVLCSDGFDVQTASLEGGQAALAILKLVHGTGFVAGKKGVIVTARHVVADAKFVVVLVPGAARPLPAKVIHTDEERDVAFLRVLEMVPVRADWKNAKRLEVGQKIFAVGYPIDSTRSDAQSVEGTVSSLMPDGNVQLGFTVNAGNFGGPVVDEKGRVQAILTRGDDVKAGATGMALATPVTAFKQELIREVYNKRAGELDALGSDGALKAAELLVLEQSESTSLLRLATRVDSEQSRAAEAKLRSYSKLAAQTPEVAMYMAAFFWNQHVALARKGLAADSARSNAKTLVETALALDASYQSPFTELARSDRSAVNVVEEKEDVAAKPTDTKTVRFVAPEGVSLLGHLAQLRGVGATQRGAVAVRQDNYERVCPSSCDVSFKPGEFDLALALNEGQAVPLDEPVKLDGSSDMHATYVDESGTRTGGLVLFLGGVIGGTVLGVISLFPNCDESGRSCQRNNLGIIAGAAGVGLGVGLGLPMMFASDEVGVKLVPRGPGNSTPTARREPGLAVDYSGRF